MVERNPPQRRVACEIFRSRPAKACDEHREEMGALAVEVVATIPCRQRAAGIGQIDPRSVAERDRRRPAASLEHAGDDKVGLQGCSLEQHSFHDSGSDGVDACDLDMTLPGAEIERRPFHANGGREPLQ
ncbi:hypothetical protein QU38_01660, partial [Staphylococcus aureus]